MPNVIDLLSWIALSLGGAFVFIGGIGILRMPEFYTRMHAAGLTETLGSLLVLAGLMLQAGLALSTLKLVAILLFLMLTGPTAAYAMASAARLAGLSPDGQILTQRDR